MTINPGSEWRPYGDYLVLVKVHHHKDSGRWHWNVNAQLKDTPEAKIHGWADPAHLTGFSDMGEANNAGWNAAKDEIDKLIARGEQ